MGIVYCTSCGYQIYDGARFCSGCGKNLVQPVSPQSREIQTIEKSTAGEGDVKAQSGKQATLVAHPLVIIAGLFVLGLVALVTTSFSTKTKSPPPSLPSDSEQVDTPVAPPGNANEPEWTYGEPEDEMGRGIIRIASLKSVNEIEFSSPYRGSQRGTLALRAHPKAGKSVILSITRGQFLCRMDECTVSVRFDDGKPENFSATGPADDSTTLLFLKNYDRFLAKLRKSEKVYIEAAFYQEGTKVFEFDTRGLVW